MFRKPLITLGIACALGTAGSVSAQESSPPPAPPGVQGRIVKMITPIFSQLMVLTYPQGFQPVYEKTNGNFYIHEFVPVGESLNGWTRMMTITGFKDLATRPDLSPKAVFTNIATAVKAKCPSSFSVQGIGEGKLGGYDAYVAIMSCGISTAAGGKSSESALVAAIKGQADYYTLQWAERAAPSEQPLPIDVHAWAEKAKLIGQIKFCPRIPGEKPPYPSCVGL